MKYNNENPWTPDDEKEHFPKILEWWCGQAFFKTLEDKKKWSIKGSFAQWFYKPNQIGSNYILTLFDIDNNKHYSTYLRNDKEKLKIKKENFQANYNDSYIKGSYPNYEMFFRDSNNNYEINLKYNAISFPHWIAQEVTDGWLPMGTGFYRYGFIPRLNVNGTMKFKEKKFEIKGEGYYEHVWGDFSYTDPLSNNSDIKKTIDTYKKLFQWWIKNHKIKIPNKLKFSTENNPLGYDWVWGILDNGWSFFFGNILFWIEEGPIAGSLILTKDGKKYNEYPNVFFQYNKMIYSKEYDFFYPSEIEITAIGQDEEVTLKFKMNTAAYEFISKIDKKHWLAFVICEGPGKVTGWYSNNKEKIKLNGICKMEPQRQVSVKGHNSLELNFTKPPKGVGIDVNIDSHYLKKQIMAKIHLAPIPKIKFKIKKLDKKYFSNLRK